jgi:hypothetical protein
MNLHSSVWVTVLPSMHITSIRLFLWERRWASHTNFEDRVNIWTSRTLDKKSYLWISLHFNPSKWRLQYLSYGVESINSLLSGCVDQWDFLCVSFICLLSWCAGSGRFLVWFKWPNSDKNFSGRESLLSKWSIFKTTLMWCRKQSNLCSLSYIHLWLSLRVMHRHKGPMFW